jgi:Glycosyl transferases group 1
MNNRFTNDILSPWREEGCQRIPQNFEEFRRLIAEAQKYMRTRNYETAAVYSEMAAMHATHKHCGLFVSSELEEVLFNIGKKVVPNTSSSVTNVKSHKALKNILHVSTTVMSIGGHSRMIWRWITQDKMRNHSLVLTRQANYEVPKALIDAVSESNGKIDILDKESSSFISRSKRLRKIVEAADLVVLHIFNNDVIPIIALANYEQSPPIIFLNHADHMFWVGACISDVIVNLRQSGQLLSKERRATEAERNVLLPIILDPIHRTLLRSEAKKKLELPESSIILLSIAREHKYKAREGINFVNMYLPLLEKYKQAVLVVVGPGYREDWLDAIQQVDGRIIVYPEQEDTAFFYQAADIYIDSFPISSTTSLIEAGSYGTPLVTYFPFSDASAICGADMPGLSGNLIRTRNPEESIKVLSHLIEDDVYRESHGEATRKKIAETHWGNNWQKALEEIYSYSITIPRTNRILEIKDCMSLDEPDTFYICSWNINIDELIRPYVRIMPFSQRLSHWIKFVKQNKSLSEISLLLPEWLYLNYYRPLRYSLSLKS